MAPQHRTVYIALFLTGACELMCRDPYVHVRTTRPACSRRADFILRATVQEAGRTAGPLGKSYVAANERDNIDNAKVQKNYQLGSWNQLTLAFSSFRNCTGGLL